MRIKTIFLAGLFLIAILHVIPAHAAMTFGSDGMGNSQMWGTYNGGQQGAPEIVIQSGNQPGSIDSNNYFYGYDVPGYNYNGPAYNPNSGW